MKRTGPCGCSHCDSRLTSRTRTGASGYVGGDVLQLLRKTHPEYAIRALVRDDEKANAIKRAVADVQIVKGSLDDAEIVSSEASSADVVLSE